MIVRHSKVWRNIKIFEAISERDAALVRIRGVSLLQEAKFVTTICFLARSSTVF